MSTKQELQNLNNRLDKYNRKLDSAKARGDQEMITKYTDEIDKLAKKVHAIKSKQSYDLNKERKKLKAMAFSREITKAEQADIGKLKKSVKGLVLVHPMTKLGKFLELSVMTGYASKPF
ncbi:YibL family ribosome-associated protein [Vibrio sp.]|uniref:YibL family ribosome-associated protein n=1 Tax=Vibrio sp. TaxID=678 RepID=UPI00311D4706